MHPTQSRLLDTDASTLARVGARLADDIPEPVVFCDPSGAVLLCNAAFEDLSLIHI